MTLLRCVFLLQVTVTVTLGGYAQQGRPPSVGEQPEAVVRSLYSDVVARHPVGIPKDADMRAFAPYLSSSLLHTIDLARACEDDYYRLHNNPNEKPPFDWLEFGIFTGADERVSPRAFDVERTQLRKDGSYRVYVRLNWGPPSKPWIWRVAAIVMLENGHFVVDDVIFLKDETIDSEFRLSKYLTGGCVGPHWIGYDKQRNHPKQER